MYFCVVCIVCFVSFSVLFVCICVLNYCHRVATQLQLNIPHQMLSNENINVSSCRSEEGRGRGGAKACKYVPVAASIGPYKFI